MAEKYTGYALRFISGKYQGNEFPLKANQEIIVGRGSEFDIVLVEDMVSRRHAKFITGDDYVILQDLGSTNGSFVNGERIRKIRLREGDRILIGTSILKLVPFKGEDIIDDPPAGPAALPPGIPQETKHLPAFDASKALPPAGGAPPKLDFLTPSSGQLAGLPSSQDGLHHVASGSPTASSAQHVATEDELAPKRPTPDFGPASMTGTLSETPLIDLLELFANSRKNCILILTSKNEGRLHFRNGRLIYAIIDNNPSVPPLKAAYRILTWPAASFALYPPKDDEIHEAIDEDTLEIYKRAQRQKEELKRFKSELPALTHSLSITMPLRAPLRDLRPEHLDTIQLIYNYSILDTVLNKSQYSDLETYQHLVYLYKHNYIQVQ